MSESASAAQVPARASVWELVAALLASLLILPVAFFVAVIGGSDEWSVTEAWVWVLGITLVAWGSVTGVVVHFWFEGWRRVWTLPLVIVVGAAFVLALLLLLSSSIRRSVLPRGPAPTRGH
jgi:hypothetical protein